MAHFFSKFSSLGLDALKISPLGNFVTSLPGSFGFANIIQGFGVAVAGYMALQATSNLGSRLWQMWNERDGAWIPRELQGKLTEEEKTAGDILFNNLNARKAEVKALEEAPINWYKVAIVAVLIAIACLAMLFGHLTVAGALNSAPAFLTMFGTSSFKDESELTNLRREQGEAQRKLDEFVMGLLRNPRDLAPNPPMNANIGGQADPAVVDDLVKEFEEKQEEKDAGEQADPAVVGQFLKEFKAAQQKEVAQQFAQTWDAVTSNKGDSTDGRRAVSSGPAPVIENLWAAEFASRASKEDADQAADEMFEGVSLNAIWENALRSASQQPQINTPIEISDEIIARLSKAHQEFINWNSNPENADNKATSDELINEMALILVEAYEQEQNEIREGGPAPSIPQTSATDAPNWADEFKSQQETTKSFEKQWTSSEPKSSGKARLLHILGHVAPDLNGNRSSL